MGEVFGFTKSNEDYPKIIIEALSECQQAIKTSYEDYSYQLDLLVDILRRASRCQSPIESLLFWQFFFDWELQPTDEFFLLGCCPGGDRYDPLFFDLQESVIVEGREYRLDFYIGGYDRKASGGFKWCVEVDGHDFHEKTKEQARHDKQRDRLLQNAGFRVLRYTGSEVWRDPAAIVAEITKALEKDD